jgi:hypothetical protein
MRDGALLPGVKMPKLGPVPPDPHPDKRVQAMRESWDMRIIGWEGVWPDGFRPRSLARPAGMQLGRGAA